MRPLSIPRHVAAVTAVSGSRLAPQVLWQPDQPLAYRQTELHRRIRDRRVYGRSLDFDVRREHAFVESVPVLNGNAIDVRHGVGSARFYMEEGIGLGVVRDWFTEVGLQIYNPDYALFTLREDDEPHYTKISEFSVHQDRYLEFFTAVGRFLALSIVSNNPVGVTFPVMFYAKLLGVPLTLADISRDEPALFRSLSQIMHMSADELEGFELEFGDAGAIEVTLANREALVERKVNSLMDPATDSQFAAISTAFFEVIPLAIIRDLVTPSELRDIVFGNPTIDVEDMIAHIGFSGYYRHSTQIQWLFALLRSFDQPRLAAFLRFVSSTTQVPIGGFANFGDITIQRAHASYDSLPTSHTCYRQLDLPVYPTEAILRAKVELAIRTDAGMGTI